MRVALIATLALAVLSSGCSGSKNTTGPVNLDTGKVYGPYQSGSYRSGPAPEALPISKPPHIVVPGIPDGPVTEQAMVVNPVNPGVTPIAAARLANLLPAPLKGWAADEANGVSLTTPQGILTEGQRSYWSGKITEHGATPDGGEGGKSIGVTIIDRGQTGASVVELASVAADERRGVKAQPVTVEGFSGQQFIAGPGFSQLDLDVTDRFLVRVRGANVSFEEMQAWAAKVPLKDLAALR